MEKLTPINEVNANAVSFETMPAFIGKMFNKIERIEDILSNTQSNQQELPKYVDINGAALITSKTPNALRVQISLGNLKAIKKGSRNYFDRAYLEEWISGEKTLKESL